MKSISLTLLSLTAALGLGALELPDVVGSQMVLQQQADAQLWGWAKPGSAVTVAPSWPGAKTVSATAAADSLWIVKVPTPEASFTPYSITISGDGETRQLDDVLVGEVWIAAGQSNMEMPLGGWTYQTVEGGPDAIAHSRQQADRLRMTVSNAAWARHPAKTIAGPWLKPDPQTAPRMKAAPYFFAQELSEILDVPVGVVYSAYGGTNVLAWVPEDEVAGIDNDFWLKRIDDMEVDPTSRPAGCYNAMFWPIHRFTTKGVIWYQGEANVVLYPQYADWYGRMVKSWREVCQNDTMPFIATEIAPFEYADFSPDYFKPGVAAELRMSQWHASDSIPNTYTIPTGDIGEEHIIHPRKKLPVGQRLARMAANKIYGQTGIEVEAPRFECMDVEGPTALLYFYNDQSGFEHPESLGGFEVRGSGTEFVPVVGKLKREDGRNPILLEHPAGETITAVRYAYANFPATANVVSGNGLPLVPFVTK